MNAEQKRQRSVARKTANIYNPPSPDADSEGESEDEDKDEGKQTHESRSVSPLNQPQERRSGGSQHPFDIDEDEEDAEGAEGAGDAEDKESGLFSDGYPSASNHGSTEDSTDKRPNIPPEVITPEDALALLRAENRALSIRIDTLINENDDHAIDTIRLYHENLALMTQVSELQGQNQVLLTVIGRLGNIFIAVFKIVGAHSHDTKFVHEKSSSSRTR
ncbi:hypothetical protein EV360DRAFT_73340 [Lentinula raphanica]|nr:hypothetical protein EV360DRAFT_73340 [Lentinula raphanica]